MFEVSCKKLRFERLCVDSSDKASSKFGITYSLEEGGGKCSMWAKAQRRRTGGKWTGFGTVESAAVYAIFSSPMPLHHTLSFEEITFLVAWHKQAESVMARSSSFYVTECHFHQSPLSPSCFGGSHWLYCHGKSRSCILRGSFGNSCQLLAIRRSQPISYIFFFKGERGAGEGEVFDKQR